MIMDSAPVGAGCGCKSVPSIDGTLFICCETQGGTHGLFTLLSTDIAAHKNSSRISIDIDDDVC
jgi:hypothetical protein